MPDPEEEKAEAFIARWKESGGHERANYQLFLSELCDLLKVSRPDPAKPENAQNAYTFERSVSRAQSDGTRSTRYLDLYKSGCFVLETKQGASSSASPDSSPSSSSPPLPNLDPDPNLDFASLSVGHGKRGTLGYDKALEKAFNQPKQKFSNRTKAFVSKE